MSIYQVVYNKKGLCNLHQLMITINILWVEHTSYYYKKTTRNCKWTEKKKKKKRTVLSFSSNTRVTREKAPNTYELAFLF